jgi:hypothetical protein
LPDAALPEADWADAFEMNKCRRFASMREVAQAAVGSMPPWSRWLLKLCNVVVGRFGLKPDGTGDAPDTAAQNDILPILDECADHIVLDLDDAHLNYRIVIERSALEAGDQIRVTTLVQRHNLFGRLYIAAITPFHKAIATASIRQAGYICPISVAGARLAFRLPAGSSRRRAAARRHRKRRPAPAQRRVRGYQA